MKSTTRRAHPALSHHNFEWWDVFLKGQKASALQYLFVSIVGESKNPSRRCALPPYLQVMASLTEDGRERSLDYKISGFHIPKSSWDAQVGCSGTGGVLGFQENVFGSSDFKLLPTCPSHAEEWSVCMHP